MKIGVPKESQPGERRVAATPETVKTMVKQGFTVCVEQGAGAEANLADAGFLEAGAEAIVTAAEAFAADIVIKVNAPTLDEVELIRAGAVLISFIWPAQNPALLDRLAARGVTVLAMDQVPRISRAQKLDALSSLANINGYRAVIEAAEAYGRFFTGQVTAAGRVPPAKVLVIGAGVAGLAAVGAAKALGGIVRAFDTRAAVREQVQSLGAEFLEVTITESGDGQGGYAKEMSAEFIAAEMALFRAQAKEVDIVITTALIPGRPAPKLWLGDMVDAMRAGSVVVDLAAKQGGNCDYTVPGQVVVRNGVTIIGHPELSTRLPTTASQLYGTNITHLLDDLGKNAGFKIDLTDVVVRGTLVAHEGKITWPAPPLPAPPPAAPAPAPVVAAKPATPQKPKGGFGFGSIVALALIGVWGYFRFTAQPGVASAELTAFLNHATVFTLSCFVGWQLIWNVSAALHTPLMSVTNAISGIIIVGGMLSQHGTLTAASTLLGALAVLLATINIAGGFLVTERMLRMFRK